MPQDTGLTQFSLPMFDQLEVTTSQELIVSSEDFPAKMCHLLENGRVYQKARDLVFGSNLRELLANFDPQSSCWKTCQESLPGMEPSLLQTLPRWGMWDAGGLYQLLMQARRTAGSAGSAWPTPAAQDGKNSTLPPSQAARDTLPGAILRQWPTPSASEHSGGGSAKMAVRAMTKIKRASGQHIQLKVKDLVLVNRQTPGTLNPEFVEALMGYPQGWTDISSPPHQEPPNIQQSRRALRRMRKTARKGSRHWGML